jgi:hypothetical protein
MKFLIVALFAAFETISAQFGGSFFGNDAGGQCDFRALMQAVQQKERCYDDFLQLKKEAMQAIQQADPSCNRGIFQGWQTCQPLFDPWLEQNDLSPTGIMECCFGSRVGASSRRQCEFKDKPMPPDGKLGKKGKKGRGGGSGSGESRGRGRGGGMGGPAPPGMMDMKRMHQAKKTMAGCAMEGLEESLGMVKHLGWCMEEDRPPSMQAVTGPLRTYKDKLIAKIWECYTPFMQVATNCTDVQYEDLECVGKGITWNGMFKMDCILSCHPDSLTSFCNFFTNGQQGINNFNRNDNNRFNNNRNNNNRNSNNNNNNNRNNNGFFDPFGY